MPESAQDKTNTTLGFTSVQAYTLAVITLVIGIAVGYFARGSAPAAVAPEAAQTAAATAPAGMGGRAGMGAGQLPGIGSQQQGGSSPEMLAQAAQPLLTKLQATPKDFETLRQLGNLYYDGQAFPQAIEYYNKALTIDPKNPDVLTDVGTAYWYSGDADKALAEFGKSLAVRPNHPGTMFNEGIVMWQGKKDPKGAVVVWEQLLKTNPNYEQKEQVQMLIERAKMHGAGATKG
ncbi:MAG TPA: tetratricopeptide repeat protein [Candidatus Limnocylindrales bacterium]|nr:tetratricopeptide repeat protein [Candidatus Limnocylindrales bacterium]